MFFCEDGGAYPRFLAANAANNTNGARSRQKPFDAPFALFAAFAAKSSLEPACGCPLKNFYWLTSSVS